MWAGERRNVGSWASGISARPKAHERGKGVVDKQRSAFGLAARGAGPEGSECEAGCGATG